jgi:hypothetical protein
MRWIMGATCVVDKTFVQKSFFTDYFVEGGGGNSDV